MINKIVFEVAGQKGNKEAFEEIESKIKEYQKLMNIQDWEIRLNFLTSSEMSDLMGSKDYSGCCQKNYVNKFATVCLNIEHPLTNEEIENTIIHELVHIQTGEFERMAVDLCQWSPHKEYFKDSLDLELERMVSSITKSYERLLFKEVSDG